MLLPTGLILFLFLLVVCTLLLSGLVLYFFGNVVSKKVKGAKLNVSYVLGIVLILFMLYLLIGYLPINTATPAGGPANPLMLLTDEVELAKVNQKGE